MGSFVHADANGANIQALTGVTWGTAGAAAQSGDLALIVWTFQNTLTPTDPTSESWTLVGTTDDPSARSRVLKRICDGTESGDITGWQCSAINRQSAVLYVVRGYSDVAGAVSFAETTAGTTHDCPQIGTGDGAANGDSIIVAVSERLTSGTTNATAPSGFTEHTGSEFGTGGTGGSYTGVADDGLVTSQTMPFNPAAWTGHVSGGVAVTWTIALRPTGAVTGSAVAAFGFTGTGNGIDRALGTATASFGFSGTAAGVDRALGTAGAAFGFTATAAGIDRALGSAIGSFGFTATAAGNVGAPPVTGQAVATFGFAATTLGVPRTPGQAASAFGFTATANGVDRSVGLAVTAFGFTATGSGRPRVVGFAVASFGFTATSAGTPRIHGAAVAALGFAATAQGLAGEPRDITVVAGIRNNHVTGGVRLTNLVAEVRSNHITGGVDVPRNMLTGSVEYVTAEVTFVGETAATIATVTGQVTITSDDTIPSSWGAADVTERTDVNGGALLALKKLHTAGAAGEYRVWAKITDNPEVPILKCGSFTVR